MEGIPCCHEKHRVEVEARGQSVFFFKPWPDVFHNRTHTNWLIDHKGN